MLSNIQSDTKDTLINNDLSNDLSSNIEHELLKYSSNCKKEESCNSSYSRENASINSNTYEKDVNSTYDCDKRASIEENNLVSTIKDLTRSINELKEVLNFDKLKFTECFDELFSVLITTNNLINALILNKNSSEVQKDLNKENHFKCVNTPLENEKQTAILSKNITNVRGSLITPPIPFNRNDKCSQENKQSNKYNIENSQLDKSYNTNSDLDILGLCNNTNENNNRKKHSSIPNNNELLETQKRRNHLNQRSISLMKNIFETSSSIKQHSSSLFTDEEFDEFVTKGVDSMNPLFK